MTDFTKLTETFNKNLHIIKTQLNSTKLSELYSRMGVEPNGVWNDGQLAKVVSLRGIEI